MNAALGMKYSAENKLTKSSDFLFNILLLLEGLTLQSNKQERHKEIISCQADKYENSIYFPV